MIYSHKPKKPNFFEKLLLKMPFVKKVISDDGIVILEYKKMFGKVYIINIINIKKR